MVLTVLMLIFTIFIFSKNSYAAYYYPQGINISAPKNQIKVGETLTLNIGIIADSKFDKRKDELRRSTKYSFSKHGIVTCTSKDD